MSARRFTIALVLALWAMPLTAQAPDSWTEDAEWQQFGETFLLESETTMRIYNDPNVQEELRRVGLSEACHPTENKIEQTVAGFANGYRELMIRGLRAHHTLDETYAERFLFMPNGGKDSVLKRRLIRMDSAFFDSVETETRDNVLQALRVLPDAKGDWRGRFDDWVFRSGFGLTFLAACLAETSRDTVNIKRAYDGFYKIREAQ